MLKFDQILDINTPVGVDIQVGMSMVNINKIKIPCTLNTHVCVLTLKYECLTKLKQ